MKRWLYRGDPSDVLKTPDPLPLCSAQAGSLTLFTDGSLPMVSRVGEAQWLPSRLIPHRHRPRGELQPAHEPQVDTLQKGTVKNGAKLRRMWATYFALLRRKIPLNFQVLFSSLAKLVGNVPRDDAIVARHEVPDPSLRVRCDSCRCTHEIDREGLWPYIGGVAKQNGTIPKCLNTSGISCARSYDHTVPYGTVLSEDTFPGTSCQATSGVSLRDAFAEASQQVG